MAAKVVYTRPIKAKTVRADQIPLNEYFTSRVDSGRTYLFLCIGRWAKGDQLLFYNISDGHVFGVPDRATFDHYLPVHVGYTVGGAKSHG